MEGKLFVPFFVVGKKNKKSFESNLVCGFDRRKICAIREPSVVKVDLSLKDLLERFGFFLPSFPIFEGKLSEGTLRDRLFACLPTDRWLLRDKKQDEAFSIRK